MRIVWTLTCLAALLATAAVLPAWAAEVSDIPAHGNTERFKVVVPADKDWVNTGIVLQPGDTATFAAEGDIRFNRSPLSEVQADGYAWELYHKDWILDDAAWCYDPGEEERWPHASLIGEVNDEVFYIGTKGVIAGKVGTLYLGINDCTLTEPEQFKNYGKFIVVIIVDHHKPKP